MILTSFNTQLFYRFPGPGSLSYSGHTGFRICERIISRTFVDPSTICFTVAPFVRGQGKRQELGQENRTTRRWV